jgi:hypothetical protein
MHDLASFRLVCDSFRWNKFLGGVVMGSGAMRNQPCPCGSGKKVKQCCNGRLPVSQTVTVDFGEPTAVNGVRIGPGRQIEMLRDGAVLTPLRAWTGSHREKVNGGEKPLVRVPIPPANLQLGELLALKQFDRIFAIDTNTNKIGDVVVSASCFAECRFRVDAEEEVFEYAIHGALDFQNGPVPKCENFAWHMLIRMIGTSPDYDDGKRYAIITDSDLGQHGAYNERSEPYFADYLLPDNFTLIYATDKGRDLANQVIKLCDREAGQMWRQMEAGEISLAGGLPVSGGWCSQMRGWSNSNGDFARAGWFRLFQMPLDALALP